MLTKNKGVNGYIQGIKPSVRESIGADVRLITEVEKRGPAVVRQAAVSKGEAQRLMIVEVQDVKPKKKASEEKAVT